MADRIGLDDPKVLQQHDPAGMLERIKEVPSQCQQAWQMAMDFALPADYSEVNKVLILGMGGSAIGGDLVSSLVVGEARLPVLVSRGYDLPAFVDGRTLVIVSSYSGNTEETLSCFEQALRTEAKKLVITTGGQVKAMAEERKIPVFSFDYKAQPRAALSYSFLPALCFLQKLGFISDKSGGVAETIRVLTALSQKLSETVPEVSNPAKEMAQRLYGNLPVIYGAGITAGVAYRWKTQINENSKGWACYEVFPELNHNAVVGYQFPVELADRIKVVMLRSPVLPRRVQLRYQITCQLLERAGVEYMFVDSEGSSLIAQMMSLILFGDYVSCYLAFLYGIDPSPVKTIDSLKEQLAKG